MDAPDFLFPDLSLDRLLKPLGISRAAQPRDAHLPSPAGLRHDHDYFLRRGLEAETMGHAVDRWMSRAPRAYAAKESEPRCVEIGVGPQGTLKDFTLCFANFLHVGIAGADMHLA